MKAPWFPFYTGDFLASSDVQLMEAHEVGAYVLLLTHSWQSDRPGHLPNDEGKLRRLARLSTEQWKESRELLLAKWPVADNPTERFNPRLLKEASKQVELREQKAEAGRKSAERRAASATQRQQSVNTIATPVEKNPTDVAKNSNYSQPQSQPQSSYEDVARETSPPKAGELSADLQARLATLPDTSGEVPASEGALAKPNRFRALCDALHLGAIDHEHYRTMGLQLAQGKPVRTASQWESWIAKFFTNQKQGGPLLLAKAAALRAPTPPEELPLPGKEKPGQLIVIMGISEDASMNGMKLDSARKKWPTAIVHAYLPGRRHD